MATRSAQSDAGVQVYCENAEVKRGIEALLSAKKGTADYRRFVVIWVEKDALPPERGDIPNKFLSPRVLIMLAGPPIKMDVLSTWRSWAVDICGFQEVNVAVCKKEDCQKVIERECDDWLKAVPPKECPAGVRMHDWVSMPKANSEETTSASLTIPKASSEKTNSALLTIQFGKMGQLLSQLDELRRRSKALLKGAEGEREAGIQRVASALQGEKQTDVTLLSTTPHVEYLPRILLLGETGVGKTLVARYLNGGIPVVRIPIPEYLRKEEAFEYDLFGYAKGTYTGGRAEGSVGLLMENVGRVVFLDEIGEAGPVMQAKLLAYLDDYRVRPRGWTPDPFLCPTLVVAATNRDISTDRTFRRDLLARFTDVARIPPLRERIDNLPYILDCLLQNPAINPQKEGKNEGIVTEIGEKALKALADHAYPGNFRELERVVRDACHKAARNGLDYICKQDLNFDC